MAKIDLNKKDDQTIKVGPIQKNVGMKKIIVRKTEDIKLTSAMVMCAPF